MEYQFHHLHVICTDLDKMVNFFTKSLGAKYVSARKFGTADGATLDLAGVPIFLRVAREGEEVATITARSYYGYHHIGLKVKDVDAAYAELSAQGYKFTALPAPTPAGGRVAFFEGPDGIVFEMVQG
jgi:catechol 2,3-dioxygenase-like lactoylglutathione lyase family enzyme